MVKNYTNMHGNLSYLEKKRIFLLHIQSLFYSDCLESQSMHYLKQSLSAEMNNRIK